ncbi:MAG: hypothetical protein HYS53_02960, partial [Candidatus Aenigmarchaeota archaeon]|nr:hypothetical protein [Candidatus Aenigmarchaeota archaeon]
MVYFTPQDAIELFGGNEGRQALDYITGKGYDRTTGQFYGYREYLVDGSWITEPLGRVSGSRYRVNAGDVWAIAEAWKYIKRISVEKPEKPDKILEQLIDARLEPAKMPVGTLVQKLRLFSPWGPRYQNSSPEIKESDPEIATLKEMRTALYQFSAAGYVPNLLLMPADVYGTEINGLPERFVREYFKWLEEAALATLGGVADVNIMPWSEIRSNNKKRYAELKRGFEKEFVALVKPGEFAKAVKVAAAFGSGRPEQDAKRYCVERMAEAEVIYSAFKDPIKLSLVRKEKDALDGPLKRIYIIKNRAPWMG